MHEKGEKDGKVYAKINGAFALIKEQKEGLKKNPSRAKPSQDLLVYSPEAHDQKMWERLPEWLQTMIEARVDDPDVKDEDVDQSAGTDKIDGSKQDFDDDIPF